MNDINIRGRAEIKAIQKSCICVAEVLRLLKEEIKPGVDTLTLDRLAGEYIRKKQGRPAFKGYKPSFANSGFPANICVSVDNELVHGIPDRNRILEDGQIVSVDVGVEMNGFYGDAAFTYKVGEVDEEKERLMKATYEALLRSIEFATAENNLYDISNTIENVSKERGYKVVKSYTGHGIGTSLHEPPSVPNYGKRGTGPKLRKGMVMAIEPMFINGDDGLRVLDDGWTVATTNGSLCAHYELTIAVGQDKPQILTITDEGIMEI